jgi:prevent-host-death family protein
MGVRTLSSRDFNQDTSAAKRAAADGPVIITDRGLPSHVLLSFEAYQQLLADGPSVLEALAQVEGPDVAFDPPRLGEDVFRAADLD